MATSIRSELHQRRRGRGHLAGATSTARALAEPRLLRFTTGRRKQVWNRNCVALGLASGFLEPLESTSIHLIQSGIARLIHMLPDRHMSAVLQSIATTREAAFEMRTHPRFPHPALLRHRARDSAFWNYCAHDGHPDAAADDIRLFRDSGRFYRNAEEMFALTSWVQVMIGQRIVPPGYHPLVDSVPEAELEQLGESVRGVDR